MKTDRELLELAAKAAGYRCHRHGEIIPFEVKTDPMGPWIAWNPADDDGDSARLRRKLRIIVQWFPKHVSAAHFNKLGHGVHWSEDYGDDPGAAERRAVVRAAAAIGGVMP